MRIPMDLFEVQLNILEELLNKKHMYLRDVLQYTEAQQKNIQQQEFSKFESYSNKKKALIDEINKMDEHFQIVFSRILKEQKVDTFAQLAIAPQKAFVLKGLIQQIIESTFKIQAIERQNQFHIDQNLHAMRERLKHVSEYKNTKSVISAYKQNNKPQFSPKK